MAVMTSKKLVEKCIDIANNYKTIYVMGCFGAPISGANVSRYCNNHEYNRRRERTSLIKAVANKGYFGFDCVNLIKGILWGWCGDESKTYGGAKYNTNGVPDTNADGMIKLCKDVSTDFSKIEVGEAVWLKGHIGVYIGNGLAVECTPSWDNDVQITAVGNIGKKSGYNTRTWTKHGKIPYVSYEKGAETPAKPVEPATPTLTLEEVVKKTINGEYGNGEERKKRIPAETPYTYKEVQAAVNASLKGTGAVNTAPKVEYYPKYTGDSLSVVDALKSLKIDSSLEHRKEIAAANGLPITKDMKEANSKMRKLLKEGKLIKE